jgi:hypothetical protein
MFTPAPGVSPSDQAFYDRRFILSYTFLERRRQITQYRIGIWLRLVIDAAGNQSVSKLPGWMEIKGGIRNIN